MSENVQSFVNSLEQGDMVGAQDAFNAELSDRISAAMDAKKIEVASSIFGSGDEVSSDDYEDGEDLVVDEDDVTEEE